MVIVIHFSHLLNFLFTAQIFQKKIRFCDCKTTFKNLKNEGRKCQKKLARNHIQSNEVVLFKIFVY